MQTPKIIFLKISTNKEKLLSLIQTVQSQIDNGLKTLIACETKDVATYLDELLWGFSDESFIPHSVANEEVMEVVAINYNDLNVNQATVLINLCQKAHPAFKEFSNIYELYDETHPVKEEAAKEKRNFYHSHGFTTTLIKKE